MPAWRHENLSLRTVMEKDRSMPPKDKAPPTSLAEEQRLAFEQDRERKRKPLLSLGWSNPIFRN
jgi:hypothetical protein